MGELKLEQPRGRELCGGDLLAQSLHALGVEVVFGLHGGHLDAFLMGCHDIGIRLIDTRHETVAVQAAEGYTRVTDKVGVCFATANSGFSNALPGLATAFADRNPIFCITSSPPLRDAETNSLQGFHDQVVVAKPLTKFAHRVTNAEEIPRLVAYGFRTAIAGAPGPVLLDCPIDVLFSAVQGKVSWGAIMNPLPSPPGACMQSIAQTVELWGEASRPVIIIGTGVKSESATKTLLQLAERTNTPVFHSMKHSGIIPFDHPYRGGVATATLPLLAATGASQPDFVLLLGARTGFLLGARGGAVIPNSNRTVVQIDTDGSEIGRSLAIDLGIVSDSGRALTALLDAAQDRSFAVDNTWVQTALELKTLPQPQEKDAEVMEDDRLHPYHALKAVYSALPEGSVVCIDGGDAGQWATQLLEIARPSLSIVTTGYLGFLGNGWGYSLGAALGAPDKQILNIHGDGSAGFHIQELDTYARFGVKLLTVIVNNSVWGMSQGGQRIMYGDHTDARPAAKLNPGCKYEMVAEGFGVAGARVDRMDQIEPAVKKLTSSGGPGLINLIVSDQPTHPVTKAMVGKTDDPNVIVVPYYDNVPRPYYKGGKDGESIVEANGSA